MLQTPEKEDKVRFSNGDYLDSHMLGMVREDKVGGYSQDYCINMSGNISLTRDIEGRRCQDCTSNLILKM